jgi:hypothetical protein
MKTRLTLAFAVLALTLGIARTAPAAPDPCLRFCAVAFCPTGGCGLHTNSSGQKVWAASTPSPAPRVDHSMPVRTILPIVLPDSTAACARRRFSALSGP